MLCLPFDFHSQETWAHLHLVFKAACLNAGKKTRYSTALSSGAAQWLVLPLQDSLPSVCLSRMSEPAQLGCAVAIYNLLVLRLQCRFHSLFLHRRHRVVLQGDKYTESQSL